MLRQNETLRRALMFATLVATVVYLGYRGLYTLNLDGWYASAASTGLLAAEVYGSFLMLLYFFSVWKIEDPDPVDPLEDRTVDVYIPTYNEDPELLRGTIAAALALDYPHETYVLDDGKRPEVRELCHKMGAHYIDRPDNSHAKAGNLNHAMTKTRGEFIIIYDADHIAQRHFITRLLGYFEDERLAFIQTPHAFYNFDNFQGTLDYSKGVYWEEGQLFYNVIQPGKNHWNAVSFCGSAAMFRRSALEDVGGVATETITEDMQTGIRLHGRGWKSLFVNERLVSGQAATDVTSFNTQRLRWGEGNLSIFAFDNPVTMPGLTLAQRLCYLGAMLSWTTGVQKLMLYAAPIAMLLTGVSPVREFSPVLGVITTVYLATVWTTVKVVSNGYGHLLGTELTHMACFWTQIRGTYRALFKRKFARFIVTSKRGAQSNRLISYIMPQLALLVASAIAIAVAGSRWWFGATADAVAILVGGGLIGFHAWFAWVVVCRAMKSKDLRYSWRHPAAVHVSYKYQDAGGVERTGQGVTFDMNERGAGLYLFEEPRTDRMHLTFSAGGRTAEADVEVRLCRTVLDEAQTAAEGKQAWRVGVEYLEISEYTHATLWWMAATYAVARLYDRFQLTSGHAPEDSVHRDITTRFEELPERHLPITLYDLSGDRCWPAITERIGPDRAAVVLGDSAPEGERLRYELSSPAGKITGVAHAGSAKQAPIGAEVCVVQELRLGQTSERWRDRFDEMIDARPGSPLQEVIEFSPDESKLPSMKAGSTIGAGSLAAAILAIMINGWWLADEILVSRVLSEGKATPVQLAAMDDMADRLADKRKPDEHLLLRLRQAFRVIRHRPGVAKLDDVLVGAPVESFYGMLTQAQVLDGRARHEEAGRVVDMLLRRGIDLEDPIQRRQLLATAARSLTHRERFDDALPLLERLYQEDPANPEHRHALAAVLLAKGELTAAEELYEAAEAGPEEWAVFASLMSASGDYARATEVYLRIGADAGLDAELMQQAAENAVAAQQFFVAAKLFERLLEEGVTTDPGGRSVRRALAESHLWSGRPDDAIAVLQPELDRGAPGAGLLATYLQAVAATESPDPAYRPTVARLFASREAYGRDQEVLRPLADAMIRLGQTAEAAPLLAELAEQNPDSVATQLSLADALRELGQHDEAGERYAWVLERTGPVDAGLAGYRVDSGVISP